MTAQHVVVVEKNLSSSGYGAAISTSEPLSLADGQALLERAALGRAPELYKPKAQARALRVSATQYLVIHGGGSRPTRQTRLTLAEVVTPDPGVTV